jgi:hypothetical protein
MVPHGPIGSGRYPGDVSTLAFVTRSYTPLAFRPAVERALTAALLLAAIALWAIVLPVEFAVA